jgi:hypothetical protein
MGEWRYNSACFLPSVSHSLGILFKPEDGDSIFYRKVGEFLWDYTALNALFIFFFYFHFIEDVSYFIIDFIEFEI